ncbi:hypothetical protein GCM10025879_17220 [Leuconostoc litchii]|nr:hypothetical protein GCM10025879_17220 [Leuconostoc litchii]
MGDATLALNLLLNQDSEMVSVMASEIEAINAQRQEIVEEVFGAAKQIALSDEYKNDSILIIAGKDWHQGILGIVASRLVELIQKPTIVLSLTDGLYKGSGRTFGDFDLYQFMNAFRNLYDTFGGHASALGLAISSEQLINLQNQVRLKSSKLQIKSPAVDINMMLSVKEISVETYEELKLLEPFGTGNPQPIFGLNRPKIDKVSTMGTLKQHLKLVLENNIEAVGFNHPDWVPIVMNPTGLSFAATIGLNYFRGRRTVQLLLKAIDQPAAPIENTAHKQFFAQVYKFIYSHQDVNFAKNLDSIAAQLNINKNDLNIMIQVFIELGFVHVSNGFVTIISGATQRSLTTSVTYQKYLANR